MKYLILIIAVLMSIAWNLTARPGLKYNDALRSRLEKSNYAKQLVWIFFTGKEKNPDLYKFHAAATLSEKTLKRRSKVRSADQLVDEKDIPVSEKYISIIKDHGIQIRNESKWFNAVSAWVGFTDLETLDELEFVSRIEPVAAFPKNKIAAESDSEVISPRLDKTMASGFDSSVYGYSFTQLKQINVPEVHKLGFFGQGVTIAVFDNGFRLLSHEALTPLTIVDTYDFVDKKTSVVPVHPVNSSDPSSWGGHGTNTLSCIGGFKRNKLIGPAFKSDFLLARTENDSSETPLEEDNWIAAMEWAEARGADIISSSLGYINFDSSGALSYDRSFYNWTWMNGDSTRITKAANIGVSLGLVIVNSAGNEGSHPSRNTIGAPADGDSVIAVGAVDDNGVRAWFSSNGPTTLGRIKPDVMAMGYGVTAASSTSTIQYSLVAGTSFSCPLTAGVCALILSAHPGLTPAQVRWALKMTADNSSTPNNQYGYGIVNALDAVNYYGITGAPDTTVMTVSRSVLYQNAANPFNDITTIKYDVAEAGRVEITIYNILGQKVRTLLRGQHEEKNGYIVIWNGKDDFGRAVASGVYFYRMTGKNFSKTKKMLLVR